MLLTIIWGSCVIVGKCDLQDSVAKNLQDTKRCSLTGMPMLICLCLCICCPLLVIISFDKLLSSESSDLYIVSALTSPVKNCICCMLLTLRQGHLFNLMMDLWITCLNEHIYIL